MKTPFRQLNHYTDDGGQPVLEKLVGDFYFQIRNLITETSCYNEKNTFLP